MTQTRFLKSLSGRTKLKIARVRCKICGHVFLMGAKTAKSRGARRNVGCPLCHTSSAPHKAAFNQFAKSMVRMGTRFSWFVKGKTG